MVAIEALRFNYAFLLSKLVTNFTSFLSYLRRVCRMSMTAGQRMLYGYFFCEVCESLFDNNRFISDAWKLIGDRWGEAAATILYGHLVYNSLAVHSAKMEKCCRAHIPK